MNPVLVRRGGAFAPLELLGVVAIIALLIFILLSNLASARAQARQDEIVNKVQHQLPND